MALGYLAGDAVKQIGSAEQSAASQDNLLCKVGTEIIISFSVSDGFVSFSAWWGIEFLASTQS